MTAIVAVVFDWAGTMIDFGSRAPVVAMVKLLEEAGVPVSEAAVRRYMGMAKREHVAAILSEAETSNAWAAAHHAPWGEADLDRLMERLEPAMRAAAADHATLIPGVADTAARLQASGTRIGSTTGYTQAMMAPIAEAAAAQGYRPEVIVCAGDTPRGRPAPLMLWRALGLLGAWPVGACVAVDDAPVGIVAGVNAGMWTVGVAGSGNGVGLSAQDYAALDAAARAKARAGVVGEFVAAGADFVIDSVADFALAERAIAAAIAAYAKPGAAPTRILS